MITPENRAGLLARKEGGATIEKPLRTMSSPNSNLHEAWIQAIDTRWLQLSLDAFKALESQEDKILDPKLMNKADLQERFQFRKSDIRYIIGMGMQSDIRSAFRLFELGTAIKAGESRKQHQEQFYDVSRLQLLQAYVVVHALLDMSTIVGKRRRRLIGDRKKVRLSKPADETVLRMLDKLMRQKPYRGGPLMTVRH